MKFSETYNFSLTTQSLKVSQQFTMRGSAITAKDFKHALALFATIFILCSYGDARDERGHRMHSNLDSITSPNARHQRSRSASVLSSDIQQNLDADLMRGLHAKSKVSPQADICYGDDQCETCFECSMATFQCVHIAGCYVSCQDDSDCSDVTQYCTENNVCDVVLTSCDENGECPSPKICNVDTNQCMDPTPSPTMPGCCAGTSEYTVSRCRDAIDHEYCTRSSSCYWIEGEGADCDWKQTQEPQEPGCCMVTVTCYALLCSVSKKLWGVARGEFTYSHPIESITSAFRVSPVDIYFAI